MVGRRPTMKDVASRAGVAFKTVSRVINGEPGVSEETARRVRRAAAELHYRRDATAGSLRRSTRGTDSVGLLLASVDNDFDAAIHRGVEDAAQRHGLSVYAASTDEDPARERQLARGLLERRVDGLILMPSPADLGFLRPELRLGTPVVAVDRPPHGIEVDTVASDNVRGAREGVAHLIGHGHRRIAVLTHLASLHTAAQRIAGAREAWEAAGLRPSDLVVVDDLSSQEEVVTAVDALLDADAPPTALFTARNLVTMGAVRALQRRGMQREVAVIGFDDVDLADLLDPPVTSVRQHPARLGALALERLVVRRRDPAAPIERVVIPPELILRRSCGCGG